MEKHEQELTDEELKVEELFQNASHQIDAIDEQIKNLPKDKGYIPQPPRPSWISEPQSISPKRDNEDILRDLQHKIRLETSAEITTLSTRAKPEIQTRISDKLKSWHARGGRSEKALQKEEKELSDSQDFAKSLLEDHRSRMAYLNPLQPVADKGNSLDKSNEKDIDRD